MDKKQKIRVVIVFPLMAVLLILGGVIYFVLQAGSATPAAATDMAAVGNAAPVTGEAAPVEAQPSEPAQETASAPSCAFDFLIGQTPEQALEQIRPLDRPYRVLAPDAMATMDFSPERINLMTDERGIIKSVQCG